MRLAFGIIFYILAGLFSALGLMFAFVNIPEMRFAIFGLGGVLPFVVFIGLALLCHGGRNWHYGIGWTLIGASIFAVFEVYMFWVIFRDPQFTARMPPESLKGIDLMADHADPKVGFITLLIAVFLGGGLIFYGKYRNMNQP